MVPRDLAPDRFAAYPPDARRLVTAHLDTLKHLPLSVLPSLLREIASYDWKFPAEREAIESELKVLGALTAEGRQEWFHEFAAIRLSSELEQSDWVGAPAQFVEHLAAHLWTTGQMDAFRSAALHYGERLRAAAPPQTPAVPRLLITVVGRDVSEATMPLFRKLRPYGVYFNRVDATAGLKILLDAVAGRAKAHPADYGHWYIDGGEAAPHDAALTCVSYAGLAPTRTALLRKMEMAIRSSGVGPEKLRSILAQLRPSDLAIAARDAVLDRFEISLLTEGSGTQIFSTTFAQWAARETLRRAQPLTLLVRFAPRQREKGMNELLATTGTQPELDPHGSLVDADMAAYYNWVNLQRLPGAERSSTLVWFEDHAEALLVTPSLPRGTESSQRATITNLLEWLR
jgi:hypothetical protein